MKINIYSLEQFYDNREEIKRAYDKVSLLSPVFLPKEVLVWRNYIYMLEIRNFDKDLIWDYLNNDLEAEIIYNIINKRQQDKVAQMLRELLRKNIRN